MKLMKNDENEEKQDDAKRKMKLPDSRYVN